MEARRGSRPVATVIVYSLLTMDVGPAGTYSGTPRARSPPSSLHRAMLPRLAGTHAQDRKKQKRRGDAPTSPLLYSGLVKLVLVTASYVTW
jgi:hypothetical protein